MADEAVPVQVRPGVPLFLFIGAIAQLGERLFCKQEVNGSIPFSSTSIFFYNYNYVGFHGGVAQLARASGSYPLGRGFESLRRYQYLDP